MKNVTDRRDGARHLWAAAKFRGEFGAPNTTVQKADAQVVVLICGDLDGGRASGLDPGLRSEKDSLAVFPVKRITGNRNRIVEKAPVMTVAARPRHVLLAAGRPPVRLAADGH